MSDGAFDVTIAPASTLWDFTSGAAVLPDADQLKAAAEKVDYTKGTSPPAPPCFPTPIS